jgi:hypothetical protein
MASSSTPLPNIPFFQRAHAAAQKNPRKPAIIDTRTNKEHTYIDLLHDAQSFKEKLLATATSASSDSDLNEARVAALVPNGCESALAQKDRDGYSTRKNSQADETTSIRCTDSWVVAQWGTWVRCCLSSFMNWVQMLMFKDVIGTLRMLAHP